MEAVLITVYLIVVIAMIAVILLQRSEGGGLGMGGGSNALLTVRGSANLLTRTTGILAALFMATAIGLTVLSGVDRGTRSILEQAGAGGDTPTSVLDALTDLQNDLSGDDALPVPAPSEGTAPPAEDTVTPAPADDPALAIPSLDDLNTDAGVVEAPPATGEPAAEGEPAADETPAAPVN